MNPNGIPKFKDLVFLCFNDLYKLWKDEYYSESNETF